MAITAFKLPTEMLDAIDEAAEPRSGSTFIGEAVKARLAQERQEATA